MPKISVVLPVYNGEKYLKESIASVLNQSFEDWELIIVDDCSSDSTANIALEYVQKDKRISYYRNEENQKLPRALNIGFSKAQGDYFTWTSCDNIYANNALEKMIPILLNQKDVGLVYTSMDIIDEYGNAQGYLEAGPGNQLIFRNVVGACFLYRKDVAHKVGEYDPSFFLCEDYEYWLRIARISTIKPLHERLYLYRRHGNSLSEKNTQEIIAKGIVVQKKYYNDFIKSHNDAAQFYAHLRARDIYNPFRQLYLFPVLYYSPKQFIIELCGLVKRRFA